MSTEQLHWYPSKIDAWLIPAICVPPVAAVAFCIGSALVGTTTDLLLSIAAVLLVASIFVGLVFPMRYAMDASSLIVRFGICRRRLPLAKISEVQPSHNPLSAAALSLDRLRVQFGPGVFNFVLISPVERECFLDELSRKAGQKRQGLRLFRMDAAGIAEES